MIRCPNHTSVVVVVVELVVLAAVVAVAGGDDEYYGLIFIWYKWEDLFERWWISWNDFYWMYVRRFICDFTDSL